MRVRIVDEAALGALRPRQVRLYLRTSGWEPAGRPGISPDVWQYEAQAGTYEVIAPTTESRDYAARIGELLRTLSVVEERSEANVLRDLHSVSFDVQNIRLRHGGPSGTAPIRDAATALGAAFSALSASTVSLERPRLVLPHRRPAKTRELMRRVLAGTSPGSYVVSMWVPIPARLVPEEDDVLFEVEDAPFERAATQHFRQAVEAARSASREALHLGAGLEAFTQRMDRGVSANLCEALAELSGEDNVPFEVLFTWSLDRPMRIGKREPITFGSESQSLLQEAARELRAMAPEDDVRLRGNVVRLQRERKSGPGEITIAGVMVDDEAEKLRRVTVELSEPDYEQAIRAHDDYLEVEVSGSLLTKGTRSQLTKATGFKLLREE